MSNNFHDDIRSYDSFTRAGYVYHKVWMRNGFVLWRMEHVLEPLPYNQYELWRIKNYANPDGSTVCAAAGDRDFGISAWYICGPESVCQAKIQAKMERSGKNLI